MKDFIANVRDLGSAKLATLGGVVLIMVAFMGIVMMRAPSLDGLLYSDLESKDAAEAAAALDRAHVSFRVSDDGSAIYVEKRKVAEARLQLAKNGLPSTGNIGNEIFDQKSGMAMSEFEENIDRQRALEGELARSLMLVRGVRNARIHLVLRHREIFSSDEQKSQASVILSLERNAKLSAENIEAILNLVSAAVPALDRANISVIDNRGRLLSHQGGVSSADAEFDPMRQRRERETQLAEAVEKILGASVGIEHMTVQTNLEMNFDRVRETRESFDPDQQVIRSQDVKNEKNTSSPDKNISVGNNLPNASNDQTQSRLSSSRQEEVNNYEIGKTTEVTAREVPRIIRQTIAVALDYKKENTSKGEVKYVPWSNEELSHLNDLVKAAVGFSAARGDSVTVVSMKFDNDLEQSTRKDLVNSWLPISLFASQGIMRFSVALAGILSLGFFVLRPLVTGKKSSTGTRSGEVIESVASAPVALSAFRSNETALLPGPVSEERYSAGGKETLRISGGTTLISNSDVKDGLGQISSRERAAELSDSQPDASLAVLRGWLSEGGVTG